MVSLDVINEYMVALSAVVLRKKTKILFDL